MAVSTPEQIAAMTALDSATGIMPVINAASRLAAAVLVMNNIDNTPENRLIAARIVMNNSTTHAIRVAAANIVIDIGIAGTTTTDNADKQKANELVTMTLSDFLDVSDSMVQMQAIFGDSMNKASCLALIGTRISTNPPVPVTDSYFNIISKFQLFCTNFGDYIDYEGDFDSDIVTFKSKTDAVDAAANAYKTSKYPSDPSALLNAINVAKVNLYEQIYPHCKVVNAASLAKSLDKKVSIVNSTIDIIKPTDMTAQPDTEVLTEYGI